MKAHLGSAALYVKDMDGLIYKVKSYEGFDGYDTIHLQLELIAGQVNGQWCGAIMFDEDVQDRTEICYFLQESVKECLGREYDILDELPKELDGIVE